MDSIEILNDDYLEKNAEKKGKEISNYKVAKYLIEKGYTLMYEKDTDVDTLENWLNENDYAYTNDIWFGELDNKNYPNKDTTIFGLIARELGLEFKSVNSMFVGDYEDFETHSGEVTTSIECEDEMQVDYVTWWCNNFGIEYEMSGNSVGLKDFDAENEMCFCFLYEDGKVVEACALDWSSGYENVSTEIADYLAAKDLENKFSQHVGVTNITKFIDTVLDELISQTKEVVF